MNGYIYVLINPSLDGLVKIGKTTRDPQDRVSELSSATGVPTPFMLAYKRHFSNCHLAEKIIHQSLQDRGYRLSDNREFFTIPVHEVIEYIVKMEDTVDDSEDFRFSPQASSSLQEYDLGQDYFNKGLAYLSGTSDILENHSEAAKWFEKAINVGHIESYAFLGYLYQNGSGVKKDDNKALSYYQKGSEKGDVMCYPEMAKLFSESKKLFNINNAIRCWDKFLENIKYFDKDIIAPFLYSYLLFSIKNQVNVNHNIMLQHKTEIMEYLESPISFDYDDYYSIVGYLKTC